MVSYNIIISKKLHLTVQKGAGCCMYPCAISSAASRDSAVKLITDSILDCILKPASNFSIAYTVCKKKKHKYGDAFSKSSSILEIRIEGKVIRNWDSN